MDSNNIEGFKELWRRVTVPKCPQCNIECVIEPKKPGDIKNALRDWVFEGGRKATFENLLQHLQSEGFSEFSDTLESFLREREESGLIKPYCELDNQETFDIVPLSIGNGKENYISNGIGNHETDPLSPKNYPHQKGVTIKKIRYKKRIFMLVSFILYTLIAARVGAFIDNQYPSSAESASGNRDYREITADIMSTPEATTLISPTCKKRSSNESIDFDTILSILPGLQEITNLCNEPAAELFITNSDLLYGIHDKIVCPEKVVSLKLSIHANSSELKMLLNTFCNIQNLTFVGIENCMNQINSVSWERRVFVADSVKTISFVSMFDCQVLYHMLRLNFRFPRLENLTFYCSSMYKTDVRVVEDILRSSNTETLVSCYGGSDCETLMLNLNRAISLSFGDCSL